MTLRRRLNISRTLHTHEAPVRLFPSWLSDNFGYGLSKRAPCWLCGVWRCVSGHPLIFPHLSFIVTAVISNGLSQTTFALVGSCVVFCVLEKTRIVRLLFGLWVSGIGVCPGALAAVRCGVLEDGGSSVFRMVLGLTLDEAVPRLKLLSLISLACIVGSGVGQVSKFTFTKSVTIENNSASSLCNSPQVTPCKIG